MESGSQHQRTGQPSTHPFYPSEVVPYLHTPEYQEYRRAAPHESIVWTEELEHALHQALIRNQYTGSYGRNELISRHIHRLSGRSVTAKQIADHLGVLDTFLQGVPGWEIHIRGQAAFRSLSKPSTSTSSLDQPKVNTDLHAELPSLHKPDMVDSFVDQGNSHQEAKRGLGAETERYIANLNNLEAHNLAHQDEGTEKCPVVNCEYHGEGFAHKYDLKRHLLTHFKGTMICLFCPIRESWKDKIFSQVEDFKRHLTSVHSAQQHMSHHAKRSETRSTRAWSISTQECSTCAAVFDNAQDFYDHLDDCVLAAVYRDLEREWFNDAASLEDVQGSIQKIEPEFVDRDENNDNWKLGSDNSHPKGSMDQENHQNLTLSLDGMSIQFVNESINGKSIKLRAGDDGGPQINITGGSTSRPPADDSDGDILRRPLGDDMGLSGDSVHPEPFRRWPDIPSNIGNHLSATDASEDHSVLPSLELKPVIPMPDFTIARKSAKTVGSAQGDLSPWHAFEIDRDRILNQIDERLSSLAFDFVQKNQRADTEEGRRRINQISTTMKWSEWVWHLDKLLTERYIPRKSVSNGTPKQLILVLWESLNMHIATTYNSQPEEVGRNLLRLISVGKQVVKFFNDRVAVRFFDDLYLDTERLIVDRRWDPTSTTSAPKSAPTAPSTAQPGKSTSNLDVATDSGYGSYVERKYLQASLSLQLEREMSPSSRNVDSTFSRENGRTEGKESGAVEIDESSSVYSTTSFLADSTRDAYVSAIAEQICSSVHGSLQDATIVSRVCNSLPRLLKAFSLSIGNNAPTKMHLNVMFFIRRYRRSIATACRELFLERDLWNNRDVSESMSVGEKMKLWDGMNSGSEPESAIPPFPLKMHHAELPPDDDSDDEELDEDDEPDPAPFDIDAYKDLLKSSASYTKLLSDVQRECTLISTHPNTLDRISHEILAILPISSRVSRAKSSERFSMEFNVDWNPFQIFSQLKPERSKVSIGSLIVLTGSAGMAQALTCAEYLLQTWPISGPPILELIETTTKAARWRSVESCTLPDQTEVMCFMVFSVQSRTWATRVMVNGLSTWIVEIGQILSWIGSALRASPYNESVTLCSPYIIDEDFVKAPMTLLPPDPRCSIHFETRAYLIDQQANGQCWHGLFDNPTVAEGYPIARRSHFEEGLELSLAVMASLAGTTRIHPYSEKVFLKGFSTILVPTDSVGDIVAWHLISSKNPGTRISYNAGLDLCHEKIQLPDLQRSRHVLGWCSSVKFLAGSHDASYAVKTSNLPRASSSCLLSNASISLGRVVSEGLGTISVGLNNSRARDARRHYIQKLKWIKKQFVLLWDQESKRGWLVNGTTALLHLVRASLEMDNSGSFAASTAFDPAKMTYPSPYLPSSAAWVLGNSANGKLPIYDDDEDPVLFHEHVTRFYEILEKAFDYHSGALAANSESTTSRSQLGGWDFESLAAERDPILPREAKLDSAGMAWIDLVRSVRAITLFGRGFGHLAQSSALCSSWSQVPSGKSYLVVCQEDLDEIVASWCGDLQSSPKMLTDQVIWHVSDNTVVECQCITTGRPLHSDLAQVLLPSSMVSRIPTRRGPHQENKAGAFIFGVNSNDMWHWPEVGEPSRQPLYLDSFDRKDGSLSVSHDSGLGDSCDSTSSVREDSLSSSQQLPVPQMERPLWPSLELTSDNYTVGIICALHIELMAVRILFDNTHEEVTICSTDSNSYAFGSMGQHNIVTTCLPDGEYGTNAAASVASNMRRSFPRLQTCLFVGIGGGAPTARTDIRLGDVVVSKPVGNSVGVLQYDMIKSLEHGRSQMNGYLHPPPRSVRSALSKMQSDPRLSKAPLEPYLRVIGDANEDYACPEVSSDNLYESSYGHPETEETCASCDPSMIQLRPVRSSKQPKIHYGLIGSGNQVMKDARRRDALAREHNILCFEMEAAGVMNVIPSLVIRGICDYSDSHKNKQWQRYAAATAASYTKLLLSYMKPSLESDHASPFLDRPMSINESDGGRVWAGGWEGLGEGSSVKRRRTQGPSY